MTSSITTGDRLVVEHFPTEMGIDLPEASLRYRTFGNLPDSGEAAVLFSYYTGTHESYLPWIGPGRPLDPESVFVVVIDHLGGGVSASPSNTPAPFPVVTLADTVRAARAILERLGVRRIRLAAGWSLGGLAAMEFAVTHPSVVGSVFALCSAARCSPINRVFLDSIGAALEADPAYPTARSGLSPRRGLEAFGRVYAGWAYSDAFFDDGVYREFGYADPSDVIDRWGSDHLVHDADDLMTSLRMWRDADVGRGRGGLAAALGTLDARTILMPSSTDRYFTVAENERTAPLLPHGELRILDSPLGHVAGRPGIRGAEQAAVDRCLRELLST